VPAQWIETREIPLGELTPFPGNARRGNVEQIRKSIRANGQYRSLVVRKTDEGLIILAGNHTFQALGAEGSKTARCEVIDCTDHEARKINLADNRIPELAVDDADALTELLSYLDDDYEGTGWTEEEVNRFVGLDLPEGFKEFGADDDPGDEPAAREVTCPACNHTFDPRESRTSG